MHLGAGRVIRQELSRLSRAIEDGSFRSNATIRTALEKSRGHALHVMGLVSPGGVHSHEDHLAAMIDLAADAGVPVHLHAFLDGRDTPPRSAAASLARFRGRIASLCGRYYAMDRDNRWDRISEAYAAMNKGQGPAVSTAHDAVEHAYNQSETDEFIAPTVLGD